MRILHTADWHLGKKLVEFNRLEEQKEVLAEIVTIADTQKVDLVLIAGDIFDTFNPPHEAVDLFYKIVKNLSADGRRPVLVISGNHDSPQFVQAPGPLAWQLGVILYGNYQHTVRTGDMEGGLHITKSESGFIELFIQGIDYPIRCILAPYANEILLRTNLGDDCREAEFIRIMQQKWQSLAEKYCDNQGINLFLGHFFFVQEGVEPDTEPDGERSILYVGGSQALPTNILPDPIHYAALGHLHRCHRLEGASCPVVYAGSPLSYSFSEAGQQKFVVIADLAPDKKAEIHFHPLSQGKPLHRKVFQSLEESVRWLTANPHCYVELTYVTDRAIDATIRRELYQHHSGIVHLIPQINGESNTLPHYALTAADLTQEVSSLFRKYYEWEHKNPPSDELMKIFNEITSYSAYNQ